jgi:hypothetical protein
MTNFESLAFIVLMIVVLAMVSGITADKRVRRHRRKMLR